MLGTILSGAGLALSFFGTRAAGDRAAKVQEANARNAYYAAEANAKNMEIMGMANAISVGSAGRYNAMMRMIAGKMSADSVQKVSTYNMLLQKAATEYNISLLADELPQLFEAADLDITRIWQQEARTEGALRAFQSASGTVLDEGSNKDVIVDSRTEALMDATIVGLNYKWKVDQIYDAIAKNQWEGQLAINKMAFEAEQQSRNIKNQAAFDAFGTLANASLQSWQTVLNSTAAAASERNRGVAQYNSYISGANAAREEANTRSWTNLTSNLLDIGAGMVRPNMFSSGGSSAKVSGGGGGGGSLLTQASPLYNEINQGTFFYDANDPISAAGMTT